MSTLTIILLVIIAVLALVITGFVVAIGQVGKAIEEVVARRFW